MRPHRALVGLAALFVMACVSAADAQDEPPPDWQPYFRRLAESYEIAPKSDPAEPLVLSETPVLRWSQPVRGGDDGAVYLWLKDGEPAVVGAMFCWPAADGRRACVSEFHSLMTEPVRAVREQRVAWAPEEAGIEWRLFGDAPPPGGTARQRLAQMRQLASRFRGESLDDEAGTKWGLRLLRQPLYRFDLSEQPDQDRRSTLDGAVFALAMGTDPEILLLIAARATDDVHRWHWALARFSDRPLTAWLGDEQVWAVERARSNVSTSYFASEVARLVQPPQEMEK